MGIVLIYLGKHGTNVWMCHSIILIVLACDTSRKSGTVRFVKSESKIGIIIDMAIYANYMYMYLHSSKQGDLKFPWNRHSNSHLEAEPSEPR